MRFKVFLPHVENWITLRNRSYCSWIVWIYSIWDYSLDTAYPSIFWRRNFNFIITCSERFSKKAHDACDCAACTAWVYGNHSWSYHAPCGTLWTTIGTTSTDDLLPIDYGHTFSWFYCSGSSIFYRCSKSSNCIENATKQEWFISCKRWTNQTLKKFLTF